MTDTSDTVMDFPPAVVISAAELTSKGDVEGALVLVGGAQLDDPRHLSRAGLAIFADVMGGPGASDRFDEMRVNTLRLAAELGAEDRQVVLNLEVIGAAQAISQGNLNQANAITAGSEFTPVDHAHVAASLVGQAVAGWIGPERAPGFWGALRRQYGVES